MASYQEQYRRVIGTAAKAKQRGRIGGGGRKPLSAKLEETIHSLAFPKSHSTGLRAIYQSEQSVRVGSQVSESRITVHGVPQGSILEPALFNIYITDLPSIPNMCSLESYEDADNAAALLTADLQNIAAWCSAHSLLMNPEKTKLLHLGTRQMLKKVPEHFYVTLHGKQLTPVPSARHFATINVLPASGR